jgi:glycosyltransferase involved in cell wall biosynthesis
LKALLARWGLRQIEGFAPALRRRCKHLWVASEIDRALVSHPSVSVLSNIPFSPNGFPSRSTPTRRDHRVALFVGSYVHTANRSGLVDFVARVWPEIRRRCGDAELRIVGSGGWDRMASELLAPGVEIVGAVDELSREYADASFAVVPVREGAGTKIKVAEALAFGRAVVAYDHAVRGYEPLVGNGLVSVWSDKDMVAACLDLFAHPDRRDELAARGHALARASFSYRGFEREVVESTVRAARQRVLEGSEV